MELPAPTFDDDPLPAPKIKRARRAGFSQSQAHVAYVVSSCNTRRSRWVAEMRGSIPEALVDLLPQQPSFADDTEHVVGIGLCSWSLTSPMESHTPAYGNDHCLCRLLQKRAGCLDDSPLVRYDFIDAVALDQPALLDSSCISASSVYDVCKGQRFGGTTFDDVLRRWKELVVNPSLFGTGVTIVHPRFASAICHKRLSTDFQLLRPRPLRLVFPDQPSKKVVKTWLQKREEGTRGHGFCAPPTPPPADPVINLIQKRHREYDSRWGNRKQEPQPRIRYNIDCLVDHMKCLPFLNRKDNIPAAGSALMRARLGPDASKMLDAGCEAVGVRSPGAKSLTNAIITLDITCMLIRREFNHKTETRWRYIFPDASPQARLELYGHIEDIVRNPEAQTRPVQIERNKSPLATLPHGFQSTHDKAVRTLKLQHRENGPTQIELRQCCLEVVI